jgi:hypothetical protein
MGENPCKWLIGKPVDIPLGETVTFGSGEEGAMVSTCRGWTEEEGYGFDYSEDKVSTKSCRRYREDYYDWSVRMTSDHMKDLRSSSCSGDCPSWSPDSEVRVLTYNLYQWFYDYCRQGKICRLRDRMMRDRLLEFVETRIDHYDVLML